MSSVVSQPMLSLGENDPGSVTVVLDRLRGGDSFNSEAFDTSLRPLLYAAFVRRLPKNELLALIEILYKALYSTQLDPDVHGKCCRALCQICGENLVLPSSCMISSDHLQTTSEVPIKIGSLMNLQDGMYKDGSNSIRVAIKSFRKLVDGDLKAVRKALYKDIVKLKRLSHPNVVQFLGVSDNVSQLSIISEWMENGNVRSYIEIKPQVDRLRLTLGIVQGLQYLHSCDVVHGDLKGSNVLINPSGQACLADFGLSSAVNAVLSSDDSTSVTETNSVRWIAPELLSGSDTELKRTKSSDIYSLAMVILEVFTGLDPFHKYRQHRVIFAVIQGEHPDRPENSVELGLINEIWALMRSCWDIDPMMRPTVSNVLRTLSVHEKKSKEGEEAKIDVLQDTGLLPVTLNKECPEIEEDAQPADASDKTRVVYVPPPDRGKRNIRRTTNSNAPVAKTSKGMESVPPPDQNEKRRDSQSTTDNTTPTGSISDLKTNPVYVSLPDPEEKETCCRCCVIQ